MNFIKTEWGYLVRLEYGEEIVSCLTHLVLDKDIRFAWISGIGATNDVVLGAFKPLKKEYAVQHLQRDFEITGLTGNITLLDNRPFFHLHITLADDLFQCFGGHLNRATISSTCEIKMTCSSSQITRVYDKESKLNILSFD